MTNYILKQDFVTYKSLSLEYINLTEKIRRDCIEQLNNMQVIL